MGEEDIILWQDLLDLVVAGRTSDLTCPFCRKGVIQVTQDGPRTRLECPSCRRFIEGAMRE